MTSVPPVCYIFIGALSFLMIVLKDSLYDNKKFVFIVNVLLFAALWYLSALFLKPYIHFACFGLHGLG